MSFVRRMLDRLMPSQFDPDRIVPANPRHARILRRADAFLSNPEAYRRMIEAYRTANVRRRGHP